MRNIERVVAWGLPPSFCALVRRTGRAAKVMATLGEAILIIPAKLLKGVAGAEEVEVLTNAAAGKNEASCLILAGTPAKMCDGPVQTRFTVL